MPGEPGVWVFVFGDVGMFTALFAAFAVYRGQAPEAFAASAATLSPAVGLTATLLLLLSSLLVVRALAAARRDASASASALFGAAMACGAGFSVLKVVEYAREIGAGVVPGRNDFAFFYFLMTGLHWFHLLTGLVFLAVAVRLVRRGPLSPRGTTFVEGAACFWHMVDLLWIVIFSLLYLVR